MTIEEKAVTVNKSKDFYSQNLATFSDLRNFIPSKIPCLTV